MDGNDLNLLDLRFSVETVSLMTSVTLCKLSTHAEPRYFYLTAGGKAAIDLTCDLFMCVKHTDAAVCFVYLFCRLSILLLLHELLF